MISALIPMERVGSRADERGRKRFARAAEGASVEQEFNYLNEAKLTGAKGEVVCLSLPTVRDSDVAQKGGKMAEVLDVIEPSMENQLLVLSSRHELGLPGCEVGSADSSPAGRRSS